MTATEAVMDSLPDDAGAGLLAVLTQAEDDCEDAFGVGDLFAEDASPGSALPVPAPPVVVAPLGLGGLLRGQPLDQLRQRRPAHPGQHRVAQGRQPIRPARDGVGCQEVPQRCRQRLV